MNQGYAKTAVLSECGTYRYHLSRTWLPEAGSLAFVMLNPSTADADIDDPTIRRCIGFARDLGYGGVEVVNLFGLRSTKPEALRNDSIDPVGSDNDKHILETVKRAKMVICAWSNWGSMRDRDKVVLKMLEGAGITPRALKVNGTGQPAHPLYLRSELTPHWRWENGGWAS